VSGGVAVLETRRDSAPDLEALLQVVRPAAARRQAHRDALLEQAIVPLILVSAAHAAAVEKPSGVMARRLQPAQLGGERRVIVRSAREEGPLLGLGHLERGFQYVKRALLDGGFHGCMVKAWSSRRR